MGRTTGLEPATLGTTNRCSNQLSYDRREAVRLDRNRMARKMIAHPESQIRSIADPIAA